MLPPLPSTLAELRLRNVDDGPSRCPHLTPVRLERMREDLPSSLSESGIQAHKHAVHHAPRQMILAVAWQPKPSSQPTSSATSSCHSTRISFVERHSLLHHFKNMRRIVPLPPRRLQTGTTSQDPRHPSFSLKPASMHVTGSQATIPTNITSRSMQITTAPLSANIINTAIASATI